MASTHILAIGKIEQGGEVIMTKHAYTEYLCSLTQDDEPVDGTLQAAIDYAAELEDYREAMEDEEWIRRGC